MPKRRLYPQRSRRPFRKIIAFVLMLAVGGAVFLFSSPVFNPETLRDQAISHIHNITHQTITVKGAPRFSLFPSPTLTLPLIELTPLGTPPEPRLHADNLIIGMGWLSVLQGAPAPDSITLTRPFIEITQQDGTLPAFGWLTESLGGISGTSTTTLAVLEGRAVLSNPQGEPINRIDKINIQGRRSGGGFLLDGNFAYKSTPLAFQLSAGDSSMEGQIGRDNNNRMHFKGDWQNSGDASLLGSLEMICTEACGFEIGKSASASANIAYSNTSEMLRVEGMRIEAPGTSGQGAVNVRLGGRPGMNAAVRFTTLSVPPAWLSALFAPVEQPANAATSALPPEEKALPANFDVIVNLTADSAQIGTRTLTNAMLKGALTQGVLGIEQCSFAIPSNGEVTLSGRMTDTARGLRFQGTSKAHGESLRALLGLLDSTASTLPETAFGNFSVTSNIFISPAQLRLSEADVRIGELALQGGLVTYFERTPRVEAEVLLNDINLDYFRNAWRAEQKAKGTHDFIFKINSSVNFAWLRQLSPIIDMRVRLRGFTFLDRRGDVANFKISTRQNEFGFRDIAMHYPDGDLKGDITINVAQEAPVIDVNIQTPFLDTAYFAEDPTRAPTPFINTAQGENHWSEEVFDFGWMIGVGGKINLKANQLVYRNIPYGNFALEGSLAREQFQFTKLSLERFNGKLDATGVLTGGKVPGLSAGFTLYNASIPELLGSFSRLNQPQGRVSISGTLATSGIHFRSWVEQADSKMIVIARGVDVPQFNLKAVVDAVNGSQSVAQVVSNVERALPSGSTLMSVDGNINLQRGVLVAPEMKLTAANKAVGKLVGEWHLIPWSLRLSTLWQLPMLPSETVPTLTLDVSGTPESHALKTDTSSLEAYVAKRIVGK